MKLNLGCGYDVKPGYVNVDARDIPGVEKVDLSVLPWNFADSSAEEILMLDFLEHFPYRMTEHILRESWRILRPEGKLIIQVPDLEHCARAACFLGPFKCNKCGYTYKENEVRADFFICGKCRQPWTDCSQAAIHRLYGGQDYKGNWHYTAFANLQLTRMLERNGFKDIIELEHDHQYDNWNFKLQATKSEDLWNE